VTAENILAMCSVLINVAVIGLQQKIKADIQELRANIAEKYATQSYVRTLIALRTKTSE